MRIKLTLLIIACLTPAISAHAQSDSNRYKFGAFADYASYLHKAHFRQLPGVEFYNPYWNADNTSSYAAGFLFESSMAKNSFFVLKLGFTREDGAFNASDTIDLPAPGNTIRRAKLYYYQNTKIDRFILEPAVRFKLYKKLYLEAGLFANFLLGSNFERYESLPSEGFIKFPDSTTSRFRKTGPISSLQNITGGLSLGLSYDIPLDRNGRYFLRPHIVGNYSLTKNIQELDWTTHSLRAGVSFLFTLPGKERENINPEAPLDEAPKRDEELTDRAPTKERQRVTRLYPILSYIFFDSSSHILPSRYVMLTTEQTANFSDSALPLKNALDIYRTSLNIIGYRLRKYPTAKLTITGCASGRDESPAIGMERAETIRNYLIDVWKIDKKRIMAIGRDLPETPSRNVSGIGSQENRRAELSSNDTRILAPHAAYDISEEMPAGAPGYFPYAEEYALLLFDFEKSKLSEKNLANIDLIKKMMNPEQFKTLPPNEYSVRFLGYTDATGSPGYNETLSRERAEEVRKLLPVFGSSAVGIGESILLFDNATPEGRFYCRTVVIRVEKKTP